MGWMGVAWTLMKEGVLSWGPESKERFRKAIEVAVKVRGMAPSFYGPYMLLAKIRERCC